MNCTELRVARIRRHKMGREAAEALGVNLATYFNKERGRTNVQLDEAATLTNFYNLSYSEFIEIFFDGEPLAICTDRESYDYRLSVRPLQRARINAGISTEDAAAAIAPASYKSIEFGHRRCTLEECRVLTNLYGLTIQEFNEIFFRGLLHFCKNDVLSYNSILA